MKLVRILLLIGLLLSTLGTATVATAGPAACDMRKSDSVAKLLDCVTLDGVREHQAALQAIADANGDTRASGTSGYDASVDYVVDRMTAAGYAVTRHEFPLVYTPSAILQQLTPSATSHSTGHFTGSGVGDVTADVVSVDINLTPPRESTSGCEAADFAGFPVGAIALIQRGSCDFAVKAANAQAAGATAVIIFNQGNTPAREGIASGTLGAFTATIPVVGTSFSAGVSLSDAGASARVVSYASQEVVIENVIAETPGGDPTNVVIAGAHLDSVAAGPGIQDNGSGSAALLEVAEQMSKVKPRNQVRFAWWGAEEAGLIGSTAYVNSLTASQRSEVALYLNFDMIGSPNHVFFIYDGDDSDDEGEGPGPAGSAQIEKTFERYYDSIGVPYKGTDFSGRSDYGPFIEVGIPAGGLFTGAEGIKTPEEASIWGGTAGDQYDPCYHLACDTFDNVSLTALSTNADAVAYSVLTYAMSTEDVNGKKGKGNFKPARTSAPVTGLALASS